MTLSTPVTDFPRAFQLTTTDKILALGSCFAQVVGQRLKDDRMDVLLNPTGTLYNPLSIFHLINMAVCVAKGETSAQQLAAPTVFLGTDGVWHSWSAASIVSAHSHDACVRNMVDAISQTAEQIKRMTVMMLTLGTDRYYTLNPQSHKAETSAPYMGVVANCHKMPQSLFCEKTANIDEIANMFASTMKQLLELRPNLKVILTVSPYRYIKYGLHASQLSKSRLLLATDAIQKAFEQVVYFPAYEILNDELRDYRFYAADMAHPSPVAEEYVWETFCQHYINERLRLFFREWAPIQKYHAHRPINGEPPAAAQQAMQEKTERLRLRFPEMFSNPSPLHTTPFPTNEKHHIPVANK